MTDHLRAADDIRSFCQGADQVLTEAVRTSATAFHDACQEVNGRLRRCEEYLQKGLRSEAIQLAESDPPLLDAVAMLDIPERPQWDELTGFYGLTAAPRLRIETAEALNRAYSEEQPLRHLLRVHRRLNLAHAPLRDRLATLRELFKCDGGNPVWADDVRAFEAARHRELLEETEAAIAENSFAALDRCWEEVGGSPWHAMPPANLVNRLRGVFLRQVGEELTQAHHGGHFERGQKLSEKWAQMSPQSALSADDPLWNQATPALQWVARERKRQERRMAFEVAVADLENGLRVGAPVDRLRERWATVREFGMVLPPGVQDRYFKQVEEQQHQRDYKEKLILVSVFSAGALILVALLAFMFLRPR